MPLALAPSWQLEQVPITSAWLTVLAGAQATVVWQSVQLELVLMWVLPLPLALVPLWHDTQVPVALAWLKLAGVQALLVWQVLHSAVVAMCVALLPLALVPLWQVEQAALVSAWLKVAGVQPVTLWQSAQALLVERWLADLPRAVVPLCSWRNRRSLRRGRRSHRPIRSWCGTIRNPWWSTHGCCPCRSPWCRCGTMHSYR